MNGVASVPIGTERLVKGYIQELAVYFPLAKRAKIIFPKEIVAIRYADEWRQFCRGDPSGKDLRIGLWGALRSLWWWMMPLVGWALIVVPVLILAPVGGFELLSMRTGTHPGVVLKIIVLLFIMIAAFLLLIFGHHIGKADTILVRTAFSDGIRTVAHRRLIYWRDILQSTWQARILTIPMVVINKLAVAVSYIAAVFLTVVYIAQLIGL